ncbi:MAG: sugar kinase [SAR202 cluster bacterium]|jgi:2-dehydro-3-deoxygluconokinase|nr:sugar kinase [SAR202 cluster bacterium]MQG59302.1 sugar kinase [SAR202 cluster bacterium]MQG69898.1 sugar kinase [SAR202 cluster bacterium]HAL48835.1 hypothetical protein [Dehalococcoidia bacterium]|tara:strand:- start:5212 stop:6201 length:990 start_codon:yes stop_codon:yes gene_type:complete
MKRFVTFGETLVQYNAEYAGPYDPAGSHVKGCAGAESNVAVDLKKLLPDDVETIWISRLGDDEAGRFILDSLHGQTTVVADVVTDRFTAEFHLNRIGNEPIRTYRRKGSAASELTFAVVEPHLAECDVLHVTGITPALSDTCHDTTLAAMQAAAGRGCPVSFDVNYREQLWSPGDAREVFDRMIEHANIFKVGHDEAETVWSLGLDAEQYARHFRERGVDVSIVTRGSDGAVLCDGPNVLVHPGYAVDIVDPVGAGDAFVAGFLAGILQQHNVVDLLALTSHERREVLAVSLDIANVCGALTCTTRGDTVAMPNMAQVNEFLLTIDREG